MDIKKVGRFISEQRKNLNLTQKELAEKLKVTNKAISKWECGVGYPDITIVPELCEALNITPFELFNGKKTEGTITNEIANNTVNNTLEYSKDAIEDQKKKFKKIISIVIMVAIIGFIITSIFVDYNRYLNYKEPIFVLFSSEKYLGDDRITEYYGLGYKVIRYESVTGKNIYEFGTYFKKARNASLGVEIKDTIELELIKANQPVKNDAKCFGNIKVLSTEDIDNGLVAYVWLFEKCYSTKENEIIEEANLSLPYKVTLEEIEKHTYSVKKYEFPKENDYVNEMNRLFPSNVRILIDNFYESDHYFDISKSVDEQVDNYYKEN